MNLKFHCYLMIALVGLGAFPPDDVTIGSPDGRVQFHLLGTESSRLSYRIQFKNKPVIETSSFEVTVNDVDLGQRSAVGQVERYQIDEKRPWRGVHSQAVNRCNGAKISLHHSESKTRYTLEVRVFNDGVAFRYIIPGDEASEPRASASGLRTRLRVPDETTAFKIPAGSTVWYHDFEGHYEGIHTAKEISQVQAGEWAAPPLTIKLPETLGYASITEAALINYSGMALQAAGDRLFKVRLGHAAPVSYPFRLRYGEEEGKRLANPAAVAGTITSPWRVIMIGSDLNTLVNCDIVHNVSPPPDAKLFPKGLDTGWIKPGRSVWKYLDGGENTLAEMKEFSRLAGQLGFEYNLVEGFWQRWSESELRELVEYSKQQGVKIFLWKHRRDMGDPEARRKFFKQSQDFGIAGVKLDFFDHEAKEVIDLYQACLKDAAEFQLMVNFHGANKAAGEARTWPNEMTREGVRGLEYRRTPEWSKHNTTLPFTRYLAGHADYTPVHFGDRRKETSWAHQMATAAIFTSPLLVYGVHPKNVLENPAVEIIKSIPSVWDETIALPMSEIGELAVFARRRGQTWFLALLNGPTARTVEIPLTFLGAASYKALLVRDAPENTAAVQIENNTVTRKDSLRINLRPAAGFIGRFSM